MLSQFDNLCNSCGNCFKSVRFVVQRKLANIVLIELVMLNFSSYFLVDLCCFTLHDYVYISVVYACSSSLCYCSTVAVKGGKLDWQLIALISSYLRLYFRSHASAKPDEQMEALCAQPV